MRVLKQLVIAGGKSPAKPAPDTVGGDRQRASAVKSTVVFAAPREAAAIAGQRP